MESYIIALIALVYRSPWTDCAKQRLSLTVRFHSRLVLGRQRLFRY